MRLLCVTVAALLAVSGLSAAEVAIGNLNLAYNSATGYQLVYFNNNTGTGSGCNAVYPVCSGIDITNWTLTITFGASADPNGPLIPSLVVTSPLTISSGAGEDIGAGIQFFVGVSNVWQIPLTTQGADPTEPACPPCDYQITQIELSGTLSSADITPAVRLYRPGQTYNPGDAATYTAFSPQPAFDAIWTVPASDYSADAVSPSNLPFWTDPAGFDVLVSDQASTPPSVPEPAPLLLMGGGLLILGSWKCRFRR